MKTNFTWKGLGRIVLTSMVLWVLAGPAICLALPTIGVSPNIITSTTQTDVQITITGLTAGQTVRLEKWIDANLNGYYDAADILFHWKKLVDGSHNVNASVQGDEDGLANGVIVTNVNYHALDMFHAPGSYLYRVVGGDSSDDVAFVVTATETGQWVSGSVTNGISPVPGTMVGLSVPIIDLEVAFAFTDASGNYKIYMPDDFAGQDLMTYAFNLGASYYSDFENGAGQILGTVALGETRAGVNMVLKNNGTQHITGLVRDSATQAALPGVWVEAEGVDADLVAIALTDDSGVFDIVVPPGSYEIGNWPDSAERPPLSYGYVGYDDASTEVVAPYSGLVIEFTRATILYTGQVIDTDGNPVAGYHVSAYNWNAPGTPAAGDVSAADGYFTLGLLPQAAAINWYVRGDWAMDNLVNFEYIANDFTIDTSTTPANGNDLIVQKSTAWVNGSASYTNYAPAMGEYVFAQRPNNEWPVGLDVEMEDGSFAFPLAVGEWVFGSWPNEACQQAVFLEEGQESVDIQIVVGADLGACDTDPDNDGVPRDPNVAWDNCPATPNPNQSDIDTNNIGDACDTGDYDNDGLADYKEVRVGSEIDNEDTDGDGMLDGVDPDPTTFASPLIDDAAFVRQVYVDFLNREPDVEGLTFWTGILFGGTMTRGQMVEQYLLSKEFGQTIAPVVRLYFTYYQRIPDFGGLMFWAGGFAAGMSLDNISDEFAKAQEFIDTYGELTNEEFISTMYVNVYKRQPDADGLAFWTNILDSAAMTRGQVMVEFSSSAEYLSISASQIYVTMTYMGLLRREPDQGGFDYWVDLMNQGVSGLGLIDSFLVAQEYADRFQVN